MATTIILVVIMFVFLGVYLKEERKLSSVRNAIAVFMNLFAASRMNTFPPVMSSKMLYTSQAKTKIM